MRLFRLINVKSLLGGIALTAAFQLSAQIDIESYRTRFPGHHVVKKEDINGVSIQLVKGVPKVTHHVHEEVVVLDQNGLLSLTEEKIKTGSFQSLEIKEAYVLSPTKNGEKKIKVTQITTQDADTEGSVFYDGEKEMTLIFPGLTIGSVRVLDYTIEMTEYRFPFGNFFYSYYPIEHALFEIECDTSVHLHVKSFNEEKIDIKHTVTVNRSKQVLSWTANTLEALRREPNAPPMRYFAPHVMAQISYFTTKKGRVNVGENLRDLHTNYTENIREVINEKPTNEIKQLADSITKNLTNELDKVEAIYYWVQSNIKYIAFEEGMGGFVPRQPSSIIKKRYGDCKDMASIIYSLLKSVGITSYLTWIGSRDLPYKYSDFPSTSCDNHMITTYKNNGKNYFLDGTNSFLPFGDVASFTVGKEALIHINDSTYEVAELAIPDCNYTSMIDSSIISIEGRKIKGKGATIITGYYKQMLHTGVTEIEKGKTDKVISSVTSKGNNSYIATGATITNADDRKKPLILRYDFSIDNYVSAIDNEVFINMVLDKELSFNDLKKDRLTPLEFDSKTSDNYVVVLNIPEGYALKIIPENKEYASDIVDFSIRYTREKNTLTMRLTLNIKTLLIYHDKFETWNNYLAVAKKALLNTVVLSKN